MSNQSSPNDPSEDVEANYEKAASLIKNQDDQKDPHFEEDDRNLNREYQNNQIKTNKRLMVAKTVLCFTSVLTSVAAFYQGCVTKESVDATRESVEVSKKSVEVAERSAKISEAEVKLTQKSLDLVRQQLIATEAAVVNCGLYWFGDTTSFHCHNSGRSISNRVEGRIRVSIRTLPR